ncbi:MAG TPA: carboxypeptidase-like regulatory domain-containing protein, partial [Bryobacteraceae bacterium]|nr:carboxypeptidase-like regulatory domain-containing protein [Bryobacteraceae bacterium]
MHNGLLFKAALVCLAAGMMTGQTGRGSLTGTVTDPTGSSVPGAAISAKHVATGTAFKAETSSGGVFTLPELPFGQYTVAVTKSGFQTAESTNVIISANQVTRFDLTLSVGNVQQAVQIEAVAPLLQQDSSTVQTNFTTKQVLELPLSLGAFGLRSAEAFTFLTPGVVGDQFLTSINGGQTFSNEVLIDGGSAGRGWAPGNADESAPSVDAIGEFTIKTNNFSAEYGHTGSAITSFVLKSGTNNYHGTAYEFLRNEAFNAFGFYRQANFDRKHDFGGTLGGPVWIPKIYNGRDKTFFFFSYEHTRADEKFLGSPRVVPTAAQRQGDFSELLRLQNPTIIHDPLTGLP